MLESRTARCASSQEGSARPSGARRLRPVGSSGAGSHPGRGAPSLCERALPARVKPQRPAAEGRSGPPLPVLTGGGHFFPVPSLTKKAPFPSYLHLPRDRCRRSRRPRWPAAGGTGPVAYPDAAAAAGRLLRAGGAGSWPRSARGGASSRTPRPALARLPASAAARRAHVTVRLLAGELAVPGPSVRACVRACVRARPARLSGGAGVGRSSGRRRRQGPKS